MFQLLPNTPTFRFVDRFPLLVGLSASLTVASIALVAIRGLNFGLDFAGGHELEVAMPQAFGEAEIGQALQTVAPEARLQRVGEEESNTFLILVRDPQSTNEALTRDLRAALERDTGAAVTDLRLAGGGDSLRAVLDSAATDEAVTGALTSVGLTSKGIERSTRGNEATLQVKLYSTVDKIRDALVRAANLGPDADPIRRVEFVGPQVGAEQRTQGIMAVLWSLFFVLLYIAYRFDLHFAPGAVVALVHDLSVTIGIFALFNLEFNQQTVAALLTIIGYSLNDTIVVYDRVRENGVRMRGRGVRSLVDTSLNETLSRTLLTGTTTLLVVIVLWIYGVGGIRELAVALFVGIVAGTYSSISVATPCYLYLRERFPTREATRAIKQPHGPSAP